MNNKDFKADELLKNLYFGGKDKPKNSNESETGIDIKTPKTKEKPTETTVSKENNNTVIQELEDDKQKELRDIRQSFLWTQSLTNDMNILVTMLYRNKRKSLNDLVVKVLEDFVAQEDNQELISKYKQFFDD